MQKINQTNKLQIIGGMSNSNVFNIAFVANLISGFISSTTNMIAQDVYNKNPNPKYGPDSFGWSHSNIRFSPQLSKGSFSVLGGW